MHSRMNKEYKQAAFTLHTGNQYLKSICVEFDPGSYVSIMASFMLYVVDKYAWDLHRKC